jgi:coenzyme PQQ precursor peptide PqqA
VTADAAFPLEPALATGHTLPTANNRRIWIMAWKKPRIVEVALALEINSYACAEVG